jgi:hypothetical protein
MIVKVVLPNVLKNSTVSLLSPQDVVDYLEEKEMADEYATECHSYSLRRYRFEDRDAFDAYAEQKSASAHHQKGSYTCVGRAPSSSSKNFEIVEINAFPSHQSAIANTIEVREGQIYIINSAGKTVDRIDLGQRSFTPKPTKKPESSEVHCNLDAALSEVYDFVLWNFSPHKSVDLSEVVPSSPQTVPPLGYYYCSFNYQDEVELLVRSGKLAVLKDRHGMFYSDEATLTVCLGESSEPPFDDCPKDAHLVIQSNLGSPIAIGDLINSVDEVLPSPDLGLRPGETLAYSGILTERSIDNLRKFLNIHGRRSPANFSVWKDSYGILDYKSVSRPVIRKTFPPTMTTKREESSIEKMASLIVENCAPSRITVHGEKIPSGGFMALVGAPSGNLYWSKVISAINDQKVLIYHMDPNLSRERAGLRNTKFEVIDKYDVAEDKLLRVDFAVRPTKVPLHFTCSGYDFTLDHKTGCLWWTGPIDQSKRELFYQIWEAVDRGRLSVVKDRNGVFRHILEEDCNDK